MLSKIIQGATRILGKSQGYLGLPVRDAYDDPDTPTMTSAWEPTPLELEVLNAGGTVYIQILGNEHPPIKVWASHGDGA